MQLAWSPEDEAFRAELVAFLDANTPDRRPPATTSRRRRRRARDRPAVDARLAGDAVRQRLDDPRATRPSSAAGTARPCRRSSTSRSSRGAASRAATHFPGYAIVAPSLLEYGNEEQRKLVPAAIRGDTIWCIGMSEPNAGSDLAGLQTRAEVHDDHVRRQRPEGVDELRDGREQVLLLRAHRSGRCRSTRASRCSSSTWTRPASTSGRCATSTARPSSRRCSSPTWSCRARTSSVSSTAAGPSRRVRSRTSAPGSGSTASPGFEQTVVGLVELAKRHGPRSSIPSSAASIAAAYEMAAILRALGYKGFASFAQGSSAPEHSLHEDGDVGGGQGGVRAGHGDLPARSAPVTDPERRRRSTAAGCNMFFM